MLYRYLCVKPLNKQNKTNSIVEFIQLKMFKKYKSRDPEVRLCILVYLGSSNQLPTLQFALDCITCKSSETETKQNKYQVAQIQSVALCHLIFFLEDKLDNSAFLL